MVTPDGEVAAVLAGELTLRLANLFAPSSQESRRMILDLREKLGWSRAHAAALFGVGRHTLRRWETGERRPCKAARRLIWLLHQFAFSATQLSSVADVATWGISAKQGGKELTGMSSP